MKYHKKIDILILAAGKGSRSGLSYHKSLFKINGSSIISLIIRKLKFLKSRFTLVINESNKEDFESEMLLEDINFDFVFQNNPLGMGDAVLKFEDSKNFMSSENILLSWGDLPYIKISTYKKMVYEHFENNNDFTFITADSDNAYTRVIRDKDKKIIDLIETHEDGSHPFRGERDIGIFIFKTKKIIETLKENLDGKYGKKTGEHSFLYIVKHLVKEGMKVQGYKIATTKELISLNTEHDIKLIKSYK